MAIPQKNRGKLGGGETSARGGGFPPFPPPSVSIPGIEVEFGEHSVLGKLIPDIGLKFAERCPIVHSIIR